MKLETEGSKTGFIAAMLLMSVFLAAAGINAASGRIDFLFVSSLLTWLSYLAAHKLSEGTLVDGKSLGVDKDENMTPETVTEYFGSLAGGAILAAGMGVGALGIKQISLPMTFAGAFMFNAGYVFAHISTTGEPL
jgi:hypothetical protein